MTNLPVIAAAEETGAAGIIHLKRFWSRQMAAHMGDRPGAPGSDDLRRDNVLLAGLRLGVRETLNFLMTESPSFEEFEGWVEARNGGPIEPARVERLNMALTGSGTFELEGILSEPVLSPAELAFWDAQGYVVVKRAVTEERCQAAVEAILAYADMRMDEPDSWYGSELWIPLAHHAAIWANRNSPRIHTAFAQIWRRNDLWMNVDVCGVNPPERPGYRFHGTPLHWDMTLAPPVRLGTQAILYLTDTSADQGTFSCVPGFHRRLETWLRELPDGTDPRERARQELQAVPIPGEAGDLIIWHHALPHGATPNRAALPRVVQYLNMFPSQHEVNSVWI